MTTLEKETRYHELANLKKNIAIELENTLQIPEAITAYKLASEYYFSAYSKSDFVFLLQEHRNCRFKVADLTCENTLKAIERKTIDVSFCHICDILNCNIFLITKIY